MNQEMTGVLRRQLAAERLKIRELKYVAFLSDESFKEAFRLSRGSFEVLRNVLGPHIRAGQTKYAILLETKLLVTLRFPAQGSYQVSVGADLNVGVSKSSVPRILHEVVDVINTYLCPQQITLPTEDEMNRTSGWAYKKYQLPGVIGMVDGTHVPIVPPVDEPVLPKFIFVNRKHSHSLNTQIICDHLNLNIIFFKLKFLRLLYENICTVT